MKTDLVAAVDDWAVFEPDAALRDRLLKISHAADPGIWTDRLRDPRLWADKAAVAQLAADAAADSPSATLSVLAMVMQRTGLDPPPPLAAARIRHPTDFELALLLGQWHTKNSKDGRPIGAYEAARAVRPESLTVWNNLGIAFYDSGELDKAVAVLREAVRRSPGHATSHVNLGYMLMRKRDVSGATAAYREAVRLNPRDVLARTNLGEALEAAGDAGRPRPTGRPSGATRRTPRPTAGLGTR